MPISEIHDSTMETGLKELNSFLANTAISCVFNLESGNLLIEQIYNIPCFGKISKFPVFPVRDFVFDYFPCFPCAVGILIEKLSHGFVSLPPHTHLGNRSCFGHSKCDLMLG